MSQTQKNWDWGRWEWDDKIEGYEKNRWSRWEWRRFRKKFVDKKVNYFNEKINEIKIKIFETLVSEESYIIMIMINIWDDIFCKFNVYENI